MNTKILMTFSSLFLAIMGLTISFLPNELINYLDIESNIITILFIKILGALYMAFGILNWMARGTLFGGIYNRPITMGNLMHFGVGAIALVKVASNSANYSEIIIPLTVIYIIFALFFLYIFKTSPATIEGKNNS
ncbi:hypothetical protein [Maribacter litoralis]|uniref:hypothetical protein n=1 Tax=Maribacter litoralis TaxID=2059726 RepID=UPI000E322699|nr:hypothetical protein [Maribacter litoralis]